MISSTLYAGLSIRDVLPLLGLGLALSTASQRMSFLIGVGGLAGGLGIGFVTYPTVALWVLERVPSAQSDISVLSSSIIAVGLGFLLIGPSQIRNRMTILWAVAAGVLEAITLKSSNPTVYNAFVPWLGGVVFLSIIVVVALCARTLYRPWFPVPMRILGSWLVASGLLFGLATVLKGPVASQTPASPTVALSVEDVKTLFPGYMPSPGEEEPPTEEGEQP